MTGMRPRLVVPLGLLVTACHAAPEPGAAQAKRQAIRSSTPAVTPKPEPAEVATPAPVEAPPEAPAPWPPKTPPSVQSDWCISGVTALDDESCYVLPERPSRELLIYLHGIVPPGKESPQKTKFETVVARASLRAGVVALIPRGHKGLAPKGLGDWWGWPTGDGIYRRHGAGLVEKIRAKKTLLENALGVRFERTYLAGSSSGAYFVAALALKGGLEADGFGVMSGGARFPGPELGDLPHRPVYIGFGTHDTVGDGARALGRAFERAGWPVRVEAHPLSHGANEIYLDEAFELWRKGAG
jgi:predicted esterase